MSKILKAEEFLKEKDDYGHLSVYADETAIIMIKFAKLHVKAALKAAEEIAIDFDCERNYDNSILNCYSLKDIK